MYEKISETPIREEKIKRLKAKILAEIDKRLEILKKYLAENQEFIMEDFEYCITESFVLLKLKEYVEYEYSFQTYEAKYPEYDKIVYRVSDRELEVWLQDDYYFIGGFLVDVEENQGNVFPLLNDHYFGYRFTNIFDYIHYDEKIKKQKEVESDE